MQLYNKLSSKERLLQIKNSDEKRTTLSFYKYCDIKNPLLFRNYLFLGLDKLNVLGRIYVASEGINAQVSILSTTFSEFRLFLNAISFLKNIHLNIARQQYEMSFLKLKIKVRQKIVADGLTKDNIDFSQKGAYLDALSFNTFLENPQSICIDMRNHYENEVGHFKDAITLDVDTFRESLAAAEKIIASYTKEKNILLYCTGGIRCEKASAYFINKGFKKVFQLKGGIIEYARQVEEKKIKSAFIGKNFVFDHRLSERITGDVIARCHQCGFPCDFHKNCANEACHLLFIQCKKCAKKMGDCCSEKCKEITTLSIEEQKKLRKGVRSRHRIFKKGRGKQLIFKK